MPRSKRYPGYLAPEKGDAVPKKWAALAVDCAVGDDYAGAAEPRLKLLSWTLKHANGMLAATVTKQFSEDHKRQAFWDEVERALSCRGTIACLCADAVQSLTLLGAWERIDRGEVILCKSPLLLSDPPAAVKLMIPDHPGKLLLMDTRNYGVTLPTGLAGLGRVAALAEGLPGLVGQLRLGSLKPTAGAQAMHGYRRSHMSVRPYTHCNADVLQLESESLHGGRAECYRIGMVSGPVYELDFSGFYGSIMRTLKLPVRLRHYGLDWKPFGAREFDEGRGVAARVKVKTKWPYLPCNRNGITVWPVGAFATVLCGCELQGAMLSGDVVEVYEWASYDTAIATNDYAERLLSYCYGKHAQPSADLRAVGKALLVSLAGKFAQRSRHWEDREGAEAIHRWGRWHHVSPDGTCHKYRSIAGRVQRQVGGEFSPTACPAMSAWIYAEGRSLLWQAQLIAGRDQVYYCHTDSLFVSATGYGRLRADGIVGEGEPGRLTLKGVHDWMNVRGISDYTTPSRTVRSGIALSGGSSVAENAPGWYGDTIGQALGEQRSPLPILHQSPAPARKAYLHGVVNSDGTIDPWRLG